MTQGGEETGWVTADEYLSGNVREKLRVAELAVASDLHCGEHGIFEESTAERLDASEIDVRLGATWSIGIISSSSWKKPLNRRFICAGTLK